MLAAEGKLPPGRGPGISRGLFSPEDTGRLQARGSHITIRACVSGRTTEVTSREALGMIWALFQSGASSLMAASWHADARSLIEFLVHFYGELPRVGAAQAHRTAGQRIRAMNHNWTHPYHYAALNLFGYWD